MRIILALIDFSDATPQVIRIAGQFARMLDASVYLLHVADLESDYNGDELRRDVSRGGLAREMHGKHRALQAAAKEIQKLEVKATALLVKGSPVKKALQEVERLKADLVIVGRRGRGRLYHLLPGSVGAIVASKAQCPVLVVPASKKFRSARRRKS